MRPKQFEGKSPRFVPEQYFAGKSHGTGAIFIPKRSIRYTFTVDLEGKQEGDVFNLYEDLRFSTGEKFKRVYTFKKLDDHNYDMRCPDLKGPAKLESYGDTVKLTYSLKQTLDGKTITLHFDDWMFLQPDGVVLNRALRHEVRSECGGNHDVHPEGRRQHDRAQCNAIRATDDVGTNAGAADLNAALRSVRGAHHELITP